MIDVSCAIIRNEDLQVLVVQRGPDTDHPFKWEFPGGKVEPHETPEDSVIREVSEELEMEIVIAGTQGSAEYDYGHKQVRLIPFICDTLQEKPVLNEHYAYRWVDPGELFSVDLAGADIIIAGEYVRGFNKPATQVAKGCEPESGNIKSEEKETVSDEELKAMIYRMMGTSEVGWIAASAASNPVLFRKLLDFTGDSDPRIVFRSSWALTKVCDKEPGLFAPYLPLIAEMLMVSQNGSAVRSFLKILTLTGTSSLDDSVRGRVADHCFSLLRSHESAIAVKAYSMDVLYEISVEYPDLTHELAAVLSMMPDDGAAGIKSKCRALLRKLGTTDK
jgi:8-oxo-dGTP diphosphatase